MQTQQEIPYSTTVQTDEVKERKDGKLYVRATIYVERESQKGMVIGKHGARIKAIGIGARKKIEKLVDGKVFLELNVRVEKDWTKDENSIRKLGYSTQLE